MDKQDREETILLFDHLGGGTFDVTLLSTDNGVFEVLAKSSLAVEVTQSPILPINLFNYECDVTESMEGEEEEQA